jgi:hypothetical protein
MLFYNVPNIIPASTVLNTTVNSLAMQLMEIADYSIQVVFTGTPTGTFQLQVSNETVAPKNMVVGANGVITYSPANWTNLTSSSSLVSAAGDITWNYANAGYTFVRVNYADGSSGESTAIVTVCTFNGKGW